MASIRGKEVGGEWIIEVSWRHQLGLVYVLFMGIFVIGIGCVIVTAGLFSPVHKVPMAVSAVAVIYFVGAQLFNRTTLAVRDGRLEITHGPVPWPSPGGIDVQRIRRLWVDSGSRRLFLRTVEGQEYTLLTDLPRRELDDLSALIHDKLMLHNDDAES